MGREAEDTAGGAPGGEPQRIEPLECESVELTEGPAVRGGTRGVRRGAGGLTPDGRLKTGRLAGLTMWQAVWVLSWPVMIESFLNSLVGLTDTKLAAGLGVDETDAIGGASYIMWFIGLVVMALGVGATALIARSVGRGRLGVANAVLGQSVILAIAVGVFVGAAVWFLASPVAVVLSMSEGATEAFERYMSVIAFGAPGASMLFVMIACARGAGDSKSPLIAMIVRNIVNIFVSYALSGYEIEGIGNPFNFNMGVTGIALGTVVGDVTGGAIMVWMALNGRWGITLKRRWLSPHWHTVRRLVRLGLPNFFETFGMWIGNFLVIVMVGLLGAQSVARGGGNGLLGAHIIGIRIEAFSFLPGFAMGMAAATLAGQYIGAGSEAMARAAVLRCAWLAAGVMGVVGGVFVAWPHEITAMLSDQPEHLEHTPMLLVICGVDQAPFGFAIVFRAAMRGAGDVKAVMVLTWGVTYLVRLPAAYLLSGVDIPLPDGSILVNPSPVDWGLNGLWIGLCGELLIRCLIFSARFAFGGWTRARV